MRPQVERGGGDFVHERYCQAQPRQVNPLDVVLAGVAGFDPHVVILRRVKIPEPGGPLLPTLRADDAAERPRAEARRADEIAPAALGGRFFDLKQADLRLAATERAAVFAPFKISVNGPPARFRQPAGVWLQESLREEPNVCGRAPLLKQ